MFLKCNEFLSEYVVLAITLDGSVIRTNTCEQIPQRIAFFPFPG